VSDSHEAPPSRTAPSPAGAVAAAEVIEIPAGVFKNKCLKLMDEVGDRTKQYLITKRGRPVAKLVAPDEAAPSAFGFLRGTVVERADIVAPDFEAWGDLA
jgi:prevent-host-death family protein